MFRVPDRKYWNDNWSGAVPSSSLSRLNVFNHDLMSLLKSRELNQSSRVAEIGFAPGKTLAWIYDNLTRDVVGVDYSGDGCRIAEAFYRRTGRSIRVVCDDARKVSVLERQMDLVYSIGVLEHFEDPSEMLEAHLSWLSDRGTAMILIPNYSGPYARLQARLDPSNLEIHNLTLMDPAFWQDLQKRRFPAYQLKAAFYGHPSPWLLSLQKYGPAGRLLQYVLNFLAFLWPRHTPYAGSILITARRSGAT